MLKFFLMTSMLLILSRISLAETWTISTLEWPPYVCSRCPEQGAAAKALRDAMRTQGVEIEFLFTTWHQAIQDARDGKAVGYFPAWIEGVRPGFSRSITLFRSPLGFVEPKSAPLRWKQLRDLKGKTIGVAQDYGNTSKFNQLVEKGLIRTQAVISDDTNIRKVAAGQVDAAIMDINNALYFLNVTMQDLKTKVQISSPIIQLKSLHLALHGKDSQRRQSVIRAALKKVDTARIVDSYLKRNYPFCRSTLQE